MPRLRQMLGHDDFALEWVSVYTFQCRRLESFVHGRVIFAGEAAHQVSPFGARGGNSGIQDAENLAWKLALVLSGDAPRALIDSYDAEGWRAADENIRHSTRSTDFIAPRSPQERRFRDAALALARHTRLRQAAGQFGAAVGAFHLRDARCRRRMSSRGPARATRRARAGCAAARRQGGRPGSSKLSAVKRRSSTSRTGRPPPAPLTVARSYVGSDLADADGFFGERFDASPGAPIWCAPTSISPRAGDEPTRPRSAGLAAPVGHGRGSDDPA